MEVISWATTRFRASRWRTTKTSRSEEGDIQRIEVGEHFSRTGERLRNHIGPDLFHRAFNDFEFHRVPFIIYIGGYSD